MKITTLILNDKSEPHFKAEDEIDFEALLMLSKEREQLCRTQGEEWTRDAIPFLGNDVVTAVNTGEHKDVTKAIYTLVMATWLYDSIFLGVTAAQYRESNMEFTIYGNGAVQHTRIPVQQRV